MAVNSDVITISSSRRSVFIINNGRGRYSIWMEPLQVYECEEIKCNVLIEHVRDNTQIAQWLRVEISKIN